MGSLPRHSLCPPTVTHVARLATAGIAVTGQTPSKPLSVLGRAFLPRGKAALSLSADLNVNSRALGFGGLTLVPCGPVLGWGQGKDTEEPAVETNLHVTCVCQNPFDASRRNPLYRHNNSTKKVLLVSALYGWGHYS